MNSAFDAYQKYLALKAHFERDGFDYFRYNKKTGAKVSTFQKDKNKFRFERLARRLDYEDFMLANILHKPSLWVGDLSSNEAISIYLDWRKRLESLSYIFKLELEKLDPSFNFNFIVPKAGHPPLLVQYLGNEISLETVIILDDLLGFVSRWDKDIEEAYIWPSISLKIKKYRPFLRYDREKFKKIALDLITKTTNK